MGVGQEIAQSIAESLLGKHAAGFSRAMNDQKKADASNVRTPKKAIRGATGANDLITPKRPIVGATGSEEARMARKGGRVAKSGRVKLHRGESVGRSKNRRGRGR
jgi:hypothetical protein